MRKTTFLLLLPLCAAPGVVAAVLAASHPSEATDIHASVNATQWMQWSECPDVTVAPADAAQLAWRSCGDGCQELALPDAPQRFYSALAGRAADGAPLLGLVRDEGAAQELDVFRVGTGAPIFSARMTEGFRGCLVRLRALGDAGALIETAKRDAEGHERFHAWVPAAGGAAVLARRDRSPRPPLETAVAGTLHAQTTSRTSLEVNGATVWDAPTGALVGDLAAARGAVFFTLTSAGRADVYAWDAQGGARLLVPGGGALATDGRDLVWFARDANGAPALFTAPFATRASDVHARPLRAAHQDYTDAGRGIVGDGYALHVERKRAETAPRLVLTRLADGAAWTVPARAGTRWGAPLWLDRGELAAVLDADADAVRAGKIAHGESWNIERRALAQVVR